VAETHFSGPLNSAETFTVGASVFSPTGTVFRSGEYFHGVSSNYSTTATYANATLTFSPLWLPATTRFDRISVELVTAGLDAGNLFRLGVYQDDGTLVPSALLLDAGTIPVGTGVAAGLKEINVLFTLPAGLYWLALAAQAVATTGGIPRSFQVVQLPGFPNVAPSATINSGWQMTGVTGALPALTSSLTLVTNEPRVFLHAA